MTSFFMYLGQLYLTPPQIYNSYHNLANSICIPWNKTAYKEEHLWALKSPSGFRTPCKHLWGLNLAAVASRFDFSSLDELSDLEYANDATDDLLISTHVRTAGLEFLTCFTEWDQESFPIDPPPPPTRITIYNQLISNYYHPIIENRWRAKFAARGFQFPEHARDLFLSNWKTISPSLPAFINTHFLLFILNAHPTTTRKRHFSADTRHLPKTQDNFPCPFCLDGVDCYSHFTTDCNTTTSSFRSISLQHNLSLNPSSLSTLSLREIFSLSFSSPFNTKNTKLTLAIITAFISSIYLTRKMLVAKGPGPRQLAIASSHLMANTMSNINRIIPPPNPP